VPSDCHLPPTFRLCYFDKPCSMWLLLAAVFLLNCSHCIVDVTFASQESQYKFLVQLLMRKGSELVHQCGVEFTVTTFVKVVVVVVVVVIVVIVAAAAVTVQYH
jgi:hypothetical protein